MSMLPKRILVPTDFSADARRAADAAGLMAREFGGQLTLLHVVPDSDFRAAATEAAPGIPSSEELEAQLRGEVRQAGQTELERLAADGVSATFLNVEGPPASEIVRVAREQKADLIIMGTHGRTGLQHELLGSVAERTVRLAPCSVLVVREGPH